MAIVAPVPLPHALVVKIAKHIMAQKSKALGTDHQWGLSKCHATGKYSGRCDFQITIPPQNSQQTGNTTCFGVLTFTIQPKKDNIHYVLHLNGCVA